MSPLRGHYDPPEQDHDEAITLSTRRLRAQKEYPCAYCKTPIRPGEHYTRAVLICDGALYTERSHRGAWGCDPDDA